MTDQQKLYRVFRLIQLLSQPPFKTVKHLSGILEVSKKTVYRYFDLLESVGYSIDKKEGDRYFLQLEISQSPGGLIDTEEAGFLQDLLWQSSSGHPLRDRILHKLNKQYTLRPLVQSLGKLQTFEHIRILGQAIEAGHRVQIYNYLSGDGELSTRKVEPVEFLQGYIYVWVFDLEKESYRQMKIERIGHIEILEEKIDRQHESKAVDMFGWSGPKWLSVKLALSSRAHQLLLEEHSEAHPYFYTTRGQVYFDGMVRDWRGIGRFILGLPGEIEVLEPEELRVYLRERAGKGKW